MAKYTRLLEWDKIGNLSYFPHQISKEIKKELEQIPNIQVAEDELAFYVKVGQLDTNNQIIVETHLDHPGFVINPKGEVVSIGSLHNSKLVKRLDLHKSQPVSFYTSEGKHLSDGVISNFKAIGNKLSATASKKLPTNTQVLPKVKIGVFGDLLHLRSIDNLATVYVCLELIKSLSKEQSSLNIIFIFSKLEEVFQLTATGVALRGATPFGNFSNNTHFIVLEAAPICRGNIEDGAKIALAESENHISLDPNSNNLLQRSLVQTAKESKVDLELVNLDSHSDAISYQLVGGYQNTSCILLNSKNRHNIDDQGNFVAEQVNIKSIDQIILFVEKTVKYLSKQKLVNKPKIRVLTDGEKTKRTQLINSYQLAKTRIKSKKLYPTSIREYISFGLTSLWSKLSRLDRP